jgi:hypothetical protein
VAQLTEAPYRMKGYRTLPLGDYESFRFIPPHFVKPIEGCNISLLDPFASLGWQTVKGRAIALSFPRFVSLCGWPIGNNNQTIFVPRSHAFILSELEFPLFTRHVECEFVIRDNWWVLSINLAVI